MSYLKIFNSNFRKLGNFYLVRKEADVLILVFDNLLSNYGNIQRFIGICKRNFRENYIFCYQSGVIHNNSEIHSGTSLSDILLCQ